MNIEGWITLNRKILTWNLYENTNAFRLFIHLLLNANYETKLWNGHEIRRGEFITSREKLALALNQTVSQIRSAENLLKIADSITIETTRNFTKYSIVNYEDYQGMQDSDRKQNRTPNDNQIAAKSQLLNKETINNITKEKVYTHGRDQNLFGKLEEQKTEIDIAFDGLWERFPRTRRGSKEKARTEFHRALKRASIEEIMTGFKHYPESSEVKRGYAKGCAAWLADDRWTVDYSPRAESATPGRMSFEEQKKVATKSEFDKLMKEKFGE